MDGLEWRGPDQVPENKILGWIVIAVIAFGGVFTMAAIFVPDFRDNGAFIVGTILGAFVSLAGIITGIEAARRYTDKDGGNGV